MTEPIGNGFRDPYRYFSLALLAVVFMLALATLYSTRAAEINSSLSLQEVSRLTLSVEKLTVSTDIQAYLLALPQNERPRLNMPAALWNRLQKGEDFTGDPGQRHRLDRNPETPRMTLPGRQAP